MLLEVKVMFGKRTISLLLLAVLSITGCSTQEVIKHEESTDIEPRIQLNYDSNTLVETNMKENYYELINKPSKSIHEFSTNIMNDTFSEYEAFSYPEKINFTPTALNENAILFGEAYYLNDLTNKFLAAYDLNTKEFRTLKEISPKSDQVVIGIVNVNKDMVIFQEYDYAQATAQYYIYDLTTDTYSELYQITNVGAIHYTDATFYDDFIFLNFSDPQSNRYLTMVYSLLDGSLTTIEEMNSASPVIYRNLCYYIRIDNENAKTQLVAFDMSKNTKEVLYETNTVDEFLFSLNADGEHFYLFMMSQGITQCYSVDTENREFHYEFEEDWIESVQLKNNYLSWLGEPTAENRIRAQYYLMDIEKEIQYIHDGGSIFLSDNGIAWIEYLKDEDDIAKGETYRNSNSEIRYQAFK